MQNELDELLEVAIYREIASQAVYIAAQRKTNDPDARKLMEDLAEDELRHSEILKELREKGWKADHWYRDKIPELKVSEYLIGIDRLEKASLQDTLVFAMKREQDAVEFYSRMMSALRSKEAKISCERMVHEELKHKYRLEILYEDLFLEGN